MRMLARSQMRAWALRHLSSVQGEVCPICHKVIDIGIKGEVCIDHDHDTGEIRGVLHRSCNSGEGKVANAAGRWGAKSMKYSDIVPWLENLIVYLKSPGTGLMYPGHKTDEEKHEQQLQRRRNARKVVSARMRAAKEK